MASDGRSPKECLCCGARDLDEKRLSKCTGCNVAYFCSDADCQLQAWRSHKKHCRRASNKMNTLLLRDTRVDDFELALRYATKYMRGLKHVDIIIDEDDYLNKKVVPLTSETLHSFLLSTKGQLDTLRWELEDFCVDNCGKKTNEGHVWTALQGLKVLRMKLPVFSKCQDLCTVLEQQQNTIVSLALSGLALGAHMSIRPWTRQDCIFLSTSLSRCRNLVRLELKEHWLRDADVEMMLPHLHSLRVLLLSGGGKMGYLTDRTCKLIAKSCPGLQELELSYHRKMTMPGIKRLLKSCKHLRMLQASIQLQSNDIKSLLGFAPNLTYLSIEEPFSKAFFHNVIKATGGRLVLDWFGNPSGEFGADSVFSLEELPLWLRAAYVTTKKVLDEVDEYAGDTKVVNEWDRVESRVVH